ncbi:prolipoprotein diacylglyceryl transferase [compost metagenome]
MPTQIIESVFSFGLCFLLLYVARTTNKTGLVAAIYLILYGLGRFVIEFYRGDIIRGEVGLLTTSQLIALLVVVLTSVTVYLLRNQKRLAASHEG